MNRQQLEHIIEEVGRRTGLEYFYIIGAAAVLAVLPEPSEAALVRTRDVDIVPGTADASEEDRIANQIDWVLGEGSEFEIEHQYYAQGLSRSTPQYAPSDWMIRARPVKVGDYTGLCMEIHDLALETTLPELTSTGSAAGAVFAQRKKRLRNDRPCVHPSSRLAMRAIGSFNASMNQLRLPLSTPSRLCIANSGPCTPGTNQKVGSRRSP